MRFGRSEAARRQQGDDPPRRDEVEFGGLVQGDSDVVRIVVEGPCDRGEEVLVLLGIVEEVLQPVRVGERRTAVGGQDDHLGPGGGEPFIRLHGFLGEVARGMTAAVGELDLPRARDQIGDARHVTSR